MNDVNPDFVIVGETRYSYRPLSYAWYRVLTCDLGHSSQQLHVRAD